MSTKHTPGPWEAFVSTSQGYALGIRDAGHTLEGGYEIIAEVRDPNHFPNGIPEAEANARLIAAAPELLEALKLLAGEIKLGKLNIRKDFSLINAHAGAIKAIAKAE